MRSQEKTVSVVIPTYNCREILRDCLESVRSQTYRPVELIVVDSCSTDGTRELAEQYATVLSFGGNAAHTTINARPFKQNWAHTKATGDYLYWFDSDMRMKPDTIERCVHALESENADAVIVPEESYGEGFWAQCRRLEKACYNRNPLSLTDAARFLKLSVWNELGGFDTTLGSTQDYDLQLRLNDAGYKTVKLSDCILHYEGRLSLKKHLRKKFIYGTSAMRYFRKYKSRDGLLSRQFAVVRPDFLSARDLLAREPFVAAGMISMKIMEYTAAFLGLLYSQVHKEDLQAYVGEGVAHS